MFATSVRVRPCSARCSPRSVGRVTSSCVALLGDRDVAVHALGELAFGSLHVDDSGSIETVTPEGTGIGCLPILDMARSPNLGEDLAADARCACVVAGHHAVRG